MSKCKVENCKSDPDYSCGCTDSEDYYCGAHIKLHIREGFGHNIVKHYTGISSSDKEMISMQCDNCIFRLKSLRGMMIEISKKNYDLLTALFEKNNNESET
jgi:hypothetical protein